MLLLTIFLRLVQKVSRVQIEITLLLVFVKIEKGLKMNKVQEIRGTVRLYIYVRTFINLT